MKVRILDEAEQDLMDGSQFYEAQVWAVLDCRQRPAKIQARLVSAPNGDDADDGR